MLLLTNARQLFAGKHINDTASAYPGFKNYFAGRLFRNHADCCCIFTIPAAAHYFENSFCSVRSNNCNQFTFIGNIEGVQAKDFRCSGNRWLYWNGLFIDNNAELRLQGNFAECRCNAAPGWVSHKAHCAELWSLFVPSFH